MYSNEHLHTPCIVNCLLCSLTSVCRLQESAEVVSLLRLVDLGLKSWDILDQQEFEEDELVCSAAAHTHTHTHTQHTHQLCRC